MEKKRLVTLAWGTVSLGVLSSCNEQLDIIAENSGDAVARELCQSKMDDYARNFVKQYGEPDPNHSWGFCDLPAITYGRNATRSGDDAGSGAGIVDVRRNMWIDTQDNDYKDDALASAVSVPGWPNFDGHYYTTSSSGQVLQSIEASQPHEPGQYQPAGDVTEYEIQYVSRWFREHENPTSNCTLHLSDFFIQNVSCDYDQTVYPEGENIDNTKQGGSNITDNTTDGQPIDYSLDYLCFKPIGAHDYPNVDETWTHVNNFNRGNSNLDPENKTENPYRETKYIYSSGTEDFACRPSWGTDELPFIKSYVLVKLDWDEVGADGQSHHREGYYLAFDFQADKEQTSVRCDGYYSNWIVKITPAHFTPETPKATRVMCEDLGNTYDFDFNDVVFDVAFHQNGDSYDAIINLQAAGGTMPIFVAKDPRIDGNDVYEAHRMLGVSSSTPKNVDNSDSHSVATYRIPGFTASTNADDIHIYVKNGNAVFDITGVKANLDKYDGVQYIGSSNAPQKFAVPTTVMWMNECKFIETGYSQFKDWAQKENQNVEWYNYPTTTPGLIHLKSR